MIVDCYTHTWETAAQLGRCVAGVDPEARNGTDPCGADIARHLAAAEPIDVTLVLGFQSRYLDADIPNDRVAAYVGQHRDRMIGLAGIDPSNPKEAIAEMTRARTELSMPGLNVAPAAQDFHPNSSQAMLVYAEASQAGMPILFHTGVHTSAATKLEYARPVLLDEIARELPNLKIVIAHMGFPWVDETIVLLAKHQNVYAEISWLLEQPWRAYEALLSAYHCGVTGKLLFGSGFPKAPASHVIEELYGISHLIHGTSLPTIPREHLRGIVERDTLALLGLSSHRRTPASPKTADDASEEL